MDNEIVNKVLNPQGGGQTAWALQQQVELRARPEVPSAVHTNRPSMAY